jgi:hypothetical protein
VKKKIFQEVHMEPIAQRVLTCRDEDGEKEIPIRLFAPEDMKDHWICRYEIDWPGATRRNYGVGHDSMQALVVALNLIAVTLYTSDAHEEGRLGWGKIGEGYGFPVMSSTRDLLVGSDAKFF